MERSDAPQPHYSCTTRACGGAGRAGQYECAAPSLHAPEPGMGQSWQPRPHAAPIEQQHSFMVMAFMRGSAHVPVRAG